MNAEQLWDTTLNPETRRLLQVELRRRRRRGDHRIADQADGQGRGAGAARADGAARRRGRGRRVSAPSLAAGGTPRPAAGRSGCGRPCCPTSTSSARSRTIRRTGRSSRRGSASQHEGAVRFPDFRHFIVEAGEGYPSAGFVILQGCRNPHGAVELKRIVLQPKGQGYGRALRAAARRRWRFATSARTASGSTSRSTTRARWPSTASEGFVEEGRLRDSVRSGAGYDSLIVMSLLEHEHEALVEARESQAPTRPEPGGDPMPLDDDGRAAVAQPLARSRRHALPDQRDRLAPARQVAAHAHLRRVPPAHARASAAPCSRSA